MQASYALGKPLALPVTIARRNGFRRDIEILVEGLPAGVTAAPVKATGAAGSVTLSLQAKAGPVSAAVRIVGRVAGQAEGEIGAADPRGRRGGPLTERWRCTLRAVARTWAHFYKDGIIRCWYNRLVKRPL